jgi:GTP pyrophosphokinase
MVSTTTTTIPRDLQTLLGAVPDLSATDRNLIQRAFYRAEKAHEGQNRKSGEPYFTHCLAVAAILAEMKMDAETIAAGLLHDVIEDTPFSAEELETEFGEPIVRLVTGVTKLAKLPQQNEPDGDRRTSAVKKDTEYFRRMMLTMDTDVRVVIVKLADRLHNMRTLGFMTSDKQKRIAQETMDIYAPLANRLGIWQIKWELEDLSFRYLNPEAYKAIANALQEKRADREAYVAQVADTLRNELDKNGIHNVHITARPKHIASIYKKMNRKGVPLEQIYDVRAVRVIVPELTHCYTALGIVHQLWKPIPGEFDDYIASPKDNFYRSLHTAVVDNKGRNLEIQIRTWEMHEDAEYGIAAHWRYKEGKDAGDEKFEARIAFLRRLMEFGKDSNDSTEEWMDQMQVEFLKGRIYAFTPKGDIYDLPKGATPIDFAYNVHTEIGHRCRGAKVRGKLVPLNHQLEGGDQVEILTAKRGGPSLDWLNPDLGYVITSRARNKIKHYFRKQQRDNNIVAGRNVLERELKRLGLIDKISLDSVALLFDYNRLDDFIVAIGIGEVTGNQIAHAVLDDERKKREAQEQEAELLKPALAKPLSNEISSGVSITGTSGMLVTLARCCNPLVGDEIVGYVTRGRGVSVHRVQCANMQNIPDPERLIDVSWGSTSHEQKYTVPVEIVAHDRPALLKDISTVISDAGINISSVSVVTKQHIATLYINLQISSPSQLTKVLAKVETIPNVVETRRSFHA